MNITIDGKKYSGVFCQMKDEAGSDVMTFSAVGENKSVWGVKYLQLRFKLGRYVNSQTDSNNIGIDGEEYG